MVLVQRLGEKIVCAVLHGLDGRFNRAVGRHDDDRNVLGLLDGGKPLQHLQAPEPGHVEIQEHQAGRLLLHLL